MNFSSAHPDLIRAMEQYERLRKGRPMPPRSEFYPTQFGWMVNHLYLCDVLDGGTDYCIRLFGNFWQLVYGGDDLVGRPLREIEAEGRLLALRAVYDKVVASREPLYCPGTVNWPNGESFKFERLLLPFADEQGGVSVILGTAACEMSNDDLVFFRGQGFPELVLEGHASQTGQSG